MFFVFVSTFLFEIFLNFRLCIDLSRHINLLLQPENVSLNDIKTVLPRISQDVYFTSWDLRGMYHQVFLDPSVTELFGFSYKNPDGSLSFYKYLRLPFGVASAVYLTDCLIRPIKHFCHRHNVDVSIYIDDGLTVEINYFKCLLSTYFVMSVLLCSGWHLQLSKCQLEPVRRIQYLGFILNSSTMIISLPVVKIQKVLILIDNILSAFDSNDPVSVKILASLLGKLCHAYFSHGDFIRVIARNSNHALGVYTTQYGWEGSLFVNLDMFQELSLCKEHFVPLNGQPIRTESKSIEVISPLQVSFLIDNIDPKDFDKSYNVFVSDASDHMAYSFKAGDCKIVSDYLFTPQETELSSGHRELLSIIKAFEHYSNYFSTLKGQIVIWITDSMCLYSFLRIGSRNLVIQKLLIQLKILEFKYSLKIIPKWLPRDSSLITLADCGSKLFKSSNEFGISLNDFNFLQDHFSIKFTIDCFATSKNNKVEKFISPFPQLNCYDIDFFTCSLTSSEYYFIHPPISVLSRVFNKLRLYDDITAVVVLPVWPTYPFWNSIIKGSCFTPFIKDFLLWDPFYIASTPKNFFNGHKPFKTLALLIHTGKEYAIPLPIF